MTFTQFFLMALMYIGAGTIILLFFNLIFWIKEKLTEKRLYDEEQIDLIVQRAKLQTIKELKDHLTVDEKQLDERIKYIIQKNNYKKYE